MAERSSFGSLAGTPTGSSLARAGTEQIFLCLPHRFEVERGGSPEPLLDADGGALVAEGAHDAAGGGDLGFTEAPASSSNAASLGAAKAMHRNADGAVSVSASASALRKALGGASVRPAFGSAGRGFVSLQTEFLEMAVKHGFAVTNLYTATKQETGAASDMTLLRLKPSPDARR